MPKNKFVFFYFFAFFVGIASFIHAPILTSKVSVRKLRYFISYLFTCFCIRQYYSSSFLWRFGYSLVYLNRRCNRVKQLTFTTNSGVYTVYSFACIGAFCIVGFLFGILRCISSMLLRHLMDSRASIFTTLRY